MQLSLNFITFLSLLLTASGKINPAKRKNLFFNIVIKMISKILKYSVSIKEK